VDGGIHDNDEQAGHDRRRSAWLTRQGVRVIRCTNEEVRDSLEGVLAWIRAEIVP
jgi:very-short-patch-repair endonuclease